MSELTILQDRIQFLIDEARDIEEAFWNFVSFAQVSKTRSLRPKSVLDSALEQFDGEKRPEFYDDWGWTPTREQHEQQRYIISRYEIWFNASSALIYQYLLNRWDDFAAAYPYIKDILECNNTMPHQAGKRFDEQYRVQQHSRLTDSFDRQVDLLLSVPDVVRTKALRLQKLIGADVINADLDRAERLLEIEGASRGAMIRAAGIIAAVALEKHLKLVADEYNSRCTSEQEAIDYTDEDGVVEIAGKLGQVNLLEHTELAIFQRLDTTHQNCVHPPGGDVNEPTNAEVAYLIQKARDYVNMEFFE
jgi:hypothetical protein